ncbi:tetraacyldisaccharide 4'-kinase [Myxococcota bacterium]
MAGQGHLGIETTHALACPFLVKMLRYLPCRRLVSQCLEEGVWKSPWARALGHAWAHLAEPERPADWPLDVRVVGVGGAVLGGSYKTPLVLALARALAVRGPLHVLASAYSASTSGVLQVQPSAPTSQVGDEAAWLSRELDPLKVAVMVGSNRTQVVGLLASAGCWVLVDGLLQTRPRRLHRSLLVLDARRPWGSGRCPPAGDLRARPDRLLRASDAVVLVEDDAVRPEFHSPLGGLPCFWARSELRGAIAPDGRCVSFEAMRQPRLGLILAIARPNRILRALARHHVVPSVVHLQADHTEPSRGLRAEPVDAWLTSGKCATKLGRRLGKAPVWVLDHRLTLEPNLVEFVAEGQNRASVRH